MRAAGPSGTAAAAAGTRAPAATTVGALARRFGLARSTLLYYDRIGLLRPSARSAAGYRRYGPGEEARLELICRYRRAGLDLAAIGRILDGPPDGLVRALEARLAELDREIEARHDQVRLIAGLLQRPDRARCAPANPRAARSTGHGDRGGPPRPGVTFRTLGACRRNGVGPPHFPDRLLVRAILRRPC